MTDSGEIDAEIVDMSEAMGGGSNSDAAAVTAEIQDSEEPDTENEDVVRVGDDPMMPSVTDTAQIDWAALWDEFGFDEPDATGSIVQSRTQLVAAVEASEQDIGGDAAAHIDKAEQDGLLRKKRTERGHLQGYLLEAMLS